MDGKYGVRGNDAVLWKREEKVRFDHKMLCREGMVSVSLKRWTGKAEVIILKSWIVLSAGCRWNI
jgi:hypothetical protein